MAPCLAAGLDVRLTMKSRRGAHGDDAEANDIDATWNAASLDCWCGCTLHLGTEVDWRWRRAMGE